MRTGAGSQSREIVSLERAFHGRTMGSACRHPRHGRKPRLRPDAGRLRSVPRDDPDALRTAVSDETAAVVIEPILGEAGIYPVPDEMLSAAREACDAAGALLLFDEIQTGLGRTGSLWAYEQTPVRPT